MLHNLEMPTQIYHMAAFGLSEFWKNGSTNVIENVCAEQ